MIVHFCKFNKETFECVGSGSCQAGTEDLQGGEDELVYVTDGQIHWSQAYIKNGRVFDAGAPPSEFHKLNYETGVYYFDKHGAEASVRAKRNFLLSLSDWVDTHSAQARVSADDLGLWGKYRQELRDISLQPSFPFNVIWPEEP